jgi:predicted transcriptional regulator
MAKRVTIMIDDELDKKLRHIQAKLIQKENKSISYSYVINAALKNLMKK